MAASFAFQPLAATVLVGSSAVEIRPNMRTSNVYRVRNLASVTQYFTTGQDSSVSSIGAPSDGVPSARTMGMIGNSVETFTGLGNWMIASSATGFEVTPGDGA